MKCVLVKLIDGIKDCMLRIMQKLKPTHPEEKEHSGDAQTGEDEKPDKEVS